jgi:hypothetical protein
MYRMLFIVINSIQFKNYLQTQVYFYITFKYYIYEGNVYFLVELNLPLWYKFTKYCTLCCL